MENPLVTLLREAIRESALLSDKELHDDMVRRGVIDEQGNVLKRIPQPPWEEQSNGDETPTAAEKPRKRRQRKARPAQE